MGIRKRKPWRNGSPVKGKNHPNTGDMKGDRVFVRGTVGEIKRVLQDAGIAYKRVRASGYGGVVEVIYTQWKRESPGSFFYSEKPCRMVYLDRLPSRLRQHRNF